MIQILRDLLLYEKMCSYVSRQNVFEKDLARVVFVVDNMCADEWKEKRGEEKNMR